MKRLTLCGLVFALAMASGLAGCGIFERPVSEQRNDAISDYDVGRFEQAESKLKRITENHPGDALSFYYLGRVKESQNQYEWARIYYTDALTYDPKMTAARRQLDQLLKKAPGLVSPEQPLPKTEDLPEPPTPTPKAKSIPMPPPLPGAPPASDE